MAKASRVVLMVYLLLLRRLARRQVASIRRSMLFPAVVCKTTATGRRRSSVFFSRGRSGPVRNEILVNRVGPYLNLVLKIHG